LKKIIQANFMR